MTTIFIPPHLLDTQRWRNLRIGILGGSFNPPHEGHLHIAEVALRRLDLDCVWWLVSPGNPLKGRTALLPYDERLNLCRALIRNPRFIVSDLERQMGTMRSVDTFRILKKRFPATDFILLGGMDIAHELPRWYRWRELSALTAMAFVARPPEVSLVRGNKVREIAKNNIFLTEGSLQAVTQPGECYWLLQGQMNYLSSTRLRNI